MRGGPITDWDDAYANGAHIDGAEDFPPRWAAAAEAFRLSLGDRAELDIPYGDAPRRRFDLFRPEGASRGLAVFIHGGYWKAFGKSDWSHLAAGALARGWTVALPGYTLAPAARISAITAEIAAFLGVAAARCPGPLRIAGHSAGGHLASRMLCADACPPGETGRRIENVVSISGLHDLRPFLLTAMNETLRLDEAEAAAESPALRRPVPGARITCFAGAEERPEFVRQNALLANIWRGLGADADAVVEPGRHHFDVIDGLLDPESPLTEAFLG